MAVTLESIPHRPPFLFVDKIVELSDDRIVTSTLVDPEADYFQGHYPGNPVMPGVLLCECCFQAGALLLVNRLGEEVAGTGTPVVTRITEARFRRMVRPGDTLNVETKLDDWVDNAFYLTSKAGVGGKAALRVSFACMLATEES